MRFCFQLLPVEQIPPWGGATPTLSWFGLTMGWFWIEQGEAELFRYSDAARNYWQSENPDSPPHALPYEDYQIARYWEDLLEMLPEILDPVPGDLAALVADGPAWEDWRNDARGWMETTDTNDAWDTYLAAVGWWGRRQWDAGHLAYPPKIWLWRVGDLVHIRWDNRAVTVGDGIPAWTATVGEETLPLAEFTAAISDFNDRFLREMARRVEEVQTHWTRPEIQIDPAELARSQALRERSLRAGLNPWIGEAHRDHSWEMVRAAILDSHPPSPSLAGERGED